MAGITRTFTKYYVSNQNWENQPVVFESGLLLLSDLHRRVDLMRAVSLEWLAAEVRRTNEALASADEAAEAAGQPGSVVREEEFGDGGDWYTTYTNDQAGDAARRRDAEADAKIRKAEADYEDARAVWATPEVELRQAEDYMIACLSAAPKHSPPGRADALVAEAREAWAQLWQLRAEKRALPEWTLLWNTAGWRYDVVAK